MNPQIQNLKKQIEEIEHRNFSDEKNARQFISTNNPQFDALLGGGIAIGHINEFYAQNYFDEIASLDFSIAIAANCLATRLGDLVIVQDDYFIREWGEIYAIGLMKFGISPSRILLITPKNRDHLQSCLLEVLKTSGLGAIVGAISKKSTPDLLGARKLQLAAQSGLCPIFIVSAHGAPPILTASLRAKISAQEIKSRNFKWGIEIEKSRFGAIKNFTLEYDYENHSFYLPSILEPRETIQRRFAN